MPLFNLFKDLTYRMRNLIGYFKGKDSNSVISFLLFRIWRWQLSYFVKVYRVVPETQFETETGFISVKFI